MNIDVTNLFNGSGNAVQVDCKVDLSDFSYSDYYPIKSGASVTGRVYEKAGIVHLDLNVSFIFCGVCDRCADDFERKFSFDFSRILVTELANDSDSDDYIIVEKGILDIDALIREEIQLFLPAKMLCSYECRGICPNCGKNLNYEICSCRKASDPRMEVLFQLLDEE